jgi:4,5:9,10-diseco-3-hydroxy-5,9,17-trioxoandrosta-1(10),2-diene-4-oate hydrolase
MNKDLYSRTTDVALTDATVCCLRQGQGPAVTFMHGIPLSLLTWRNNLDALARDHTVVAFDLKGFGRSQKPTGDYSPQAHARVLNRALDALGIGCTSLVASSYGCAPAIRFALDSKDRVERLVLINSVGYPGGRHSLERLLRIGGVAAMLRLALRHDRLGRALFMSRLKRSFARPAALPQEIADAYYQFFLRDGGQERFLQTLLQFDEGALAKAIPGISQPTLIIWGGRDRVLPVANARRIQADIPGAQLRILPDAGHLPHEEAPDEVNRLIADFLAAVPARDRVTG